jgi:heme a synthase
MATALTARAVRSSATAPAPPLSLARFAALVTGYNVLVVLWGAVVRATGSGAGCGEHWPLCNGTVVQHWQSLASVIEFAHRASSGIALLLLLGLVGWVWRAMPKRHLARTAVLAAAVLTFNEALLGALLVLLGLTAQNRSPLRAAYLSLHLANTLLLLGALALTTHFVQRTAGKMRGSITFVRRGAVLGTLLLMLGVGVAGSLAALGDTLYPAHSLREAFLQDVHGGGSGAWLLRLRVLHPALSVLAAAAAFGLARVGLRLPAARTAARVVTGLVVLQLALGAGDVLMLAPTAMQVLHLLAADLLWIALVVLGAQLALVPLGCPGAGGSCRATAT